MSVATRVRDASGRGLRRVPLRRTRQSLAGRYCYLLSAHAAIGTYLQEKIKETDTRECLVVQQRGTAVASPPLHQMSSVGPPDQEVMEGYRKACGWKHPRAPRSGCFGTSGQRRRSWISCGIPGSDAWEWHGDPQRRRGGQREREGRFEPAIECTPLCSFPLFVSFAFSCSLLLFGGHWDRGAGY